MLRILFLLSVGFLCPAQIHPDPFMDKVIDMNAAWNNFSRKFFGCSKEAVSIEDCSAAKATNDYKDYALARKAAKKLFEFKDEN